MYTFWVFNIAMENGPFIKDLPIKNGVCIYIYMHHIISYTHFGLAASGKTYRKATLSSCFFRDDRTFSCC